MPKLTIVVSPTGEVETKVDGVKGAKCTDITKALEKALGKTVSSKKTGEYYEQPNTVENKQNLYGG